MGGLDCPTCGEELDRIEVIDNNVNYQFERVETTYLYCCSNPKCDHWEHVTTHADVDFDDESVVTRDGGD